MRVADPASVPPPPPPMARRASFACLARRRAAVFLLGLAAPMAAVRPLRAQEVVIDAASQPAPLETGFLHMGTSASPDGHTIVATSRYLLRDGRPWLPVMGEFHFSRYPARDWEAEIEKMKAGGVDIVSTYVFWIHHEEVEGRFDWSGQRDLRRFVELCAKHGMLAWVRVGPWSHGEARNGGFPDWLLQRVGPRVRSNDSTYLRYVGRFYDQIGGQLHGLLWKDGGPVIGIQLENEYTARGAGKGSEHILRLKALARAAGLDVPLYSVTGWDGASFPSREVIPVFGGYPDAPWDASLGVLPPNEVYAFRFANRVAGNMGTQGWGGRPSETSTAALSRYPFLGAEFGGGVQVTYHRRPIIEPDDIAAMLPVQLGSGVNLYGYYMFHGGANPPGVRSTLQESQRTGYPTDVPVVSYDFQAPLGEYGQMRESFRRIRLVHEFLNTFGDALAPMVPRAPAVVPSGPADTTVPRLAARTLGDHGFVFGNNYVRDHALPTRHGVQVTLKLPDETVRVPDAPIDVPSGAYFIWPVNLRMRGVLLTYATAQLLTRVGTGDATVYAFFAVPGIVPEFAFDTASVARLDAPGARVTRSGGRVHVVGARFGTAPAISLRASDGSRVRILLLGRDGAENLWRVRLGGVDRLLLTAQQVLADGGGFRLRSEGVPRFSFAAYPALARATSPDADLRADGRDGIFHRYGATVPTHPVRIDVEKVRDDAPVPPVRRMNAVTWRKDSVALAPIDSDFAPSAVWRIRVAPDALRGVADVFLHIEYAGDVGRLEAGDRLLDDDFFKGTPWVIGLRRFAGVIAAGPLTLRVLPLRSDAPVFIPARFRPAFDANGQVATLREVTAVPEYELAVRVARLRVP